MSIYSTQGVNQNQMLQMPGPSFGDQLAMLGIQAGFQGLGAGLNYGIQDAFRPDPQSQTAGMAEADAIVAEAAATGGMPGGMTTGETATIGGVSGALTGAGTGASIGTAIMPGIGTAIGAGVGTLVGGLGGALIPLFFENDPAAPQGPTHMQMLASQGPKRLSPPVPQRPTFQQTEQMLAMQNPPFTQQYGVQDPYGYGYYS